MDSHFNFTLDFSQSGECRRPSATPDGSINALISIRRLDKRFIVSDGVVPRSKPLTWKSPKASCSSSSAPAAPERLRCLLLTSERSESLAGLYLPTIRLTMTSVNAETVEEVTVRNVQGSMLLLKYKAAKLKSWYRRIRWG